MSVAPRALAADDVVETREQAAHTARPPLVILEPLRSFLDAHSIGTGELKLTKIGDGRSNATFLVRREGADVVLRRPPRPPIPPSAHDVVREARIIAALAGTSARAPVVRAVCDDPGVIGAPFFLMERVEGVVIGESLPPVLDSETDRRRIGEELIDALAELHEVDWRAAGLDKLARPEGYLERQVRRFRQLWEYNQTRELDTIDRLARWLERTMPSSPPPTVVHGDYRLGNVMYRASAPALLTAIFDWEMATIGDPLADVGYFCVLWVDRADPPLGMYELNGVTRLPGFASRAELLDRYATRSGRDVGSIAWYQVLALWKSAIFMEGNYKRALLGATDDAFLREFGHGVIELLERAEAIAR